jgi:hypothetical protein
VITYVGLGSLAALKHDQYVLCAACCKPMSAEGVLHCSKCMVKVCNKCVEDYRWRRTKARPGSWNKSYEALDCCEQE